MGRALTLSLRGLSARARAAPEQVTAAIKEGLLIVNGDVMRKASYTVRHHGPAFIPRSAEQRGAPLLALRQIKPCREPQSSERGWPRAAPCAGEGRRRHGH